MDESRDITDSVEDLAECVKELVRIVKCFPNYHKLLKTIQGPSIEGRLDSVYKKATTAKTRIARR